MFDTLDLQNVLIFLVFFVAIWCYYTTLLPENFPPGPKPLPIIGNLATFGIDVDKTPQSLTSLGQQYGNVVGIKLGSYPVVVLNGSDAIKEAFVKNADFLSGRPTYLRIINQFTKERGLIFLSGTGWKTSRRFALRNLRDFGMGKNTIEARIQEEATEVCTEIEKYSSKPVNVKTLVHACVSNIICSICFGQRFDYQDEKFIALLNLFNAAVTSNVLFSPINFFPILSFLMQFGYGQRLMNIFAEIEMWIAERVQEHRDTFDGGRINDFVDVFLKEEQSGDKSDLEVSNIVSIIRDLFLAGTETTGTTLRWMLLIMLYFPEVQLKCQEEIDSKIGARSPSLADRENLPYVEAVIHEVQRYRPVAPFGVVHAAEKDATLYNYKIPKGTMLLPNFYSVSMDPQIFEKPDIFKPERWIKDGSFQKEQKFIPFSVGPRVCVGENLARNELFLFFTFLLQRFIFRFADSNHANTLPQGKVGGGLIPPDFNIIAELRIK